MTASPAVENDVALHRSWIAVVQGFIGSLMITVGSVGVGWIANGSPMIRNPLVIAMRTEGAGVITSTILLTLGAMVLLRSWLRLGQRLCKWGPGSLRTVVIAIIAWGAPLVLAVPIFSRDVYAYTGQGRLMAEGLDPYTSGISSLSNWFMLGTDPSWAENRTPYGPVILWLSRGVVALTGGQPDFSVLLFRVIACVGVALCVLYVPKLARLHGIDGARALWISVANPLFLLSFIASAHNDSLMLGLAVAGTYFAATKRGLLGVVLVTASIAVKPITIVLLPFIGLLWAGQAAGWGRRFLYWAGTASLSLLLLWLMGIPQNLGLGWTWALTDTVPGYTGYSPSGFGGQVVELAANTVGLNGAVIGDGFRTVLKIASIGIAAWLVLFGDPRKAVRRMGLAFAAVVLLAPIIQPWYILWFLPFLAVTGIRNNWQTKVCYVVIAFFVVFGAQDQLFVWNFVQLPIDSEVLSITVAWVVVIYLLVVDVHTRRLLFAREADSKQLV
ncbi:polyprenol phosphomannose-dependent alpha 1,6 mannosyltransferase MptB [Arthrobacter antibioticus]|uniref:polyprenol phosphomannose-dependent alpha 1,6 mannosyltransferase MptB n=1 Tax=Arthrobacter sp. H35-MC1 TaxID=3046203 RepID=UPI0024B8BBC0|nr:polyprenol phosphomannose-dependent alpha 1,6 mannosyltransferase MptB [Arthrobacter sp. H35-MC1]MDJ0316125.1 polyprenol phosphomannose-dependent alpha 1,6 mannosyltransferase MptB [Arthrobacter sp. H35-MC1]